MWINQNLKEKKNGKIWEKSKIPEGFLKVHKLFIYFVLFFSVLLACINDNSVPKKYFYLNKRFAEYSSNQIS